MKYALNLEKDTSRILSVCVILPNGNYKGMPKVYELPEGDITDYLWKGKYIYDPKPKEPDPAPPVPDDASVWDELDAAYQEGVDSV